MTIYVVLDRKLFVGVLIFFIFLFIFFKIFENLIFGKVDNFYNFVNFNIFYKHLKLEIV